MAVPFLECHTAVLADMVMIVNRRCSVSDSDSDEAVQIVVDGDCCDVIVVHWSGERG